MSDFMLIIGGEIGRSIDPDDYDFDTPADEISPKPASPGDDITAIMRMYLSAEDIVREIIVRGPLVEVRKHEPSLEDRAYINAAAAARLFAAEQIDMHDVTMILEWALEAQDSSIATEEGAELYDKIDRMHHLLRGI